MSLVEALRVLMVIDATVSVGCRNAWARPQAFDLHRFNHRRIVIHRLFRFEQNRNRIFDLAPPLVRSLRLLGEWFCDRTVLLGRFRCPGLLG